MQSAKKKLRILQVVPQLGYGGAERIAVDLAVSLDHERFDVQVVSFFDPFSSLLVDRLKEAGIPFKTLNKKLGLDPRMFVEVYREITRSKPDVLHTHLQALRYIIPHLFLAKRPYVVHTIHSIAEKEHRDYAGYWIRRLTFKGRITPVAIAHGVHESIARVYGIPECTLIANAVDVQNYSTPTVLREAWRQQEGFSDADFIFICVASIREAKNHDLLINAFAHVAGEYGSDVHLLLIGDGILRSHIEQRVQELRLENAVHLLGIRKDIPEALNAADVFVLPSNWEGNPLTVMEAMSAGLPVIATNVGGIPDLVVPDQSGILIPPQDQHALQEGMMLLFQERSLGKQMGQTGKAIAQQRFALSYMTEKYEALYLKLTKRQA